MAWRGAVLLLLLALASRPVTLAQDLQLELAPTTEIVEPATVPGSPITVASSAAGPAVAPQVYDIMSSGPVDVTIDWAVNQDVPLFKKYAVFNSGLLDSTRYNDSIFTSLGLTRTPALVTDLYMGTDNPNATLGTVITGAPDSATDNGILYNFTEIDRVAAGFASALVRPYWDYTYDPLPFQQTTVLNASNGQTRCPGFDYDYNHYQCYPYGTGLDDCWKCPPKTNETGYTTWQSVSEFFANHWRTQNISVYEQIANEPDLNNYYYDPSISVTFFAGNANDLNDLYTYAASGMLTGDVDHTIGGSGFAYILFPPTNPTEGPEYNAPNGQQLVEAVYNTSTTMDFFSFHVVSPCNNGLGCNINGVFAVRAAGARQVLTTPLVLDGDFNATELHVTEYFPSVTVDQGQLPFTASPALDILMMNDLTALLDQTDVTIITWAQYMEVNPDSNGTAMIDYYGNARPSWHTFRFFGDLPVERRSANASLESVAVVSSFSERECRGGVIVWNNDTSATETSISIDNFPFTDYSVAVYQLDDDNLPGPGFNFSAIEEYSVTGGGGTFSYPDNGTTLSLPVSGLYFLNITAADCPAFAAKPPGQLLKTHYFFGYRPYMTGSYSFFDQRNWAAYLGSGNETEGWSLAGATLIVDPTGTFNLTADLMDGSVGTSGGYGIRIDFWDADAQAYDASSSLFFYNTANAGASNGMQIPLLYGSKAAVPAANFFAEDLSGFLFTPSTISTVPAGWDGKMVVIFAMLDGTPGTKVHGYVQDGSTGSVTSQSA